MTILLTGATSGIGEALAKHYLGHGHTLYALGRNEQKLFELQQFAKKNSSECKTVCVDVCDFEALQNVAAELAKDVEKFDLIIVNAGISTPHDKNIPTFENFKLVMDTNITSIHALLYPLLPRLETGAAVVLISSLASFVALPTAIAYATSKRAVNAYADALRLALKGKGISVVNIQPGFIKTPMTDKNRFKMPFLMDVETAVKKIVCAIEKKKPQYAFPFFFSRAVKIVALLPLSLRNIVLSRFSSNG
jgi:short-subunit dehydrogenase